MTTIWNRINTIILLMVLFALLAVIAMLATGARGGPLDPPGSPGSTLPQVEPRSPIPPVGWNGTFPIVISQPGSYFFTRSLAGVSNADGIQISADSVSLDLNGFTLTGVNNPGDGIDGIVVIGLHGSIHITNGVVRDWNDGINGWSEEGEAVYSRVDHINAFSNGRNGILLGYDSEVLDCNASSNATGIGTHYSIVRGCHVADNLLYGILAEDVSLIEDNKAWNNAVGIRVDFSGAQPGNNTVRSNTSTNNTTGDFWFVGTGNVGDSNVATCPGWLITGTAAIYNQMYQRNPC